MDPTTIQVTRMDAVLQLYQEMFPAVARYVNNRGGTFDEARDLFHDAVILYFEKMHSLKVSTSGQAYLMGIVKHLWSQKQADTNKFIELDSRVEYITSPSEPLTDRLLNLIQRAGQKCLDLLTSFYYDQSSMQEIAEKFNFSSERSATVQKFKCLEKVRNTVKEKSLQYEDFFD